MEDERLRTLPPAERRRLLRKLDEFDALPEAERERIRALDDQLQAMLPEKRYRMEGLLRNYDQWLGSRPKNIRAMIQSSSPEVRSALIDKARIRQGQEHPRQAQRVRAFDNRLQVSNLSAESLLLAALQLRVWFAQDPMTRTIEQKPAALIRQQEKLLKAALESGEVARLERDLTLLLESPKWIERSEGILTEAVKQRLRRNLTPNRAEHRLKRLELGYLRNMGEPQISSNQLSNFRTELPSWIRDSLDLFPTATANRRVQLLYQLVYLGTEDAKSASGPNSLRTP